jgi:ATP synthase protein I
MTDRPIQNNGRHALWDDAEDGTSKSSFKRLSREEAAVLRAQEPPVSPWRVIAVQAVVGVVVALIGWAITGKSAVAWSMLYGAATVVVPGALMARGMTSKLSSMAPGASAVSFMLWEFVKIGVSLAMLVVAGKIVQPLVWPALLAAMVVCMKVYWVALLWRRRKA